MSTDLRGQVEQMMERHWRPGPGGGGHTVPNADTYPFQWLWDSCFHALVWAELGREDRAVAELRALFDAQHASGFVPHVVYHGDPRFHASFWGVEGTSTLTQPPMYGHVVAELIRRGVDVPAELVDRARRGLHWLLRHRRRGDGALVVCHPWETGCDNSPRFDDWCPGGFDAARWFHVKGELVAALRVDGSGAAVGSDAFEVASAGFNALVAFNLAELDDPEAAPIVDALDATWDEGCATWRDGPSGSSTRTLDALLGCLVSRRTEAVAAASAELLEPDAFGGRYGPAGVHRREPSFEPSTYWRGPAWPQLTYLHWVAARRRDDTASAARLAAALTDGARRSGFAEYWHPDTGEGLGARPQSWAGLALLVA